MNIMSDYFGMDQTFENKYENLPRYLLAKQEQMKDNSKSDNNHIAADGIKSTNKNTARKRADSIDSE